MRYKIRPLGLGDLGTRQNRHFVLLSAVAAVKKKAHKVTVPNMRFLYVLYDMLKVALYQGGSLSTNCSVNMLIRPLGPSSSSPDGLKEHFIHFPCQVKGSLS
jgi:hypothetical protein